MAFPPLRRGSILGDTRFTKTGQEPDRWSVCKDRKPGALLICNHRWLRNTAVCKPIPSCSQAATPSRRPVLRRKQAGNSHGSTLPRGIPYTEIIVYRANLEGW
jgi:hypothetical protein